jgi:hypothetical protein
MTPTPLTVVLKQVCVVEDPGKLPPPPVKVCALMNRGSNPNIDKVSNRLFLFGFLPDIVMFGFSKGLGPAYHVSHAVQFRKNKNPDLEQR